MKADLKEKEDRQEDFFSFTFFTTFFLKQANEVENEEQYQTLTHDLIS